eukprot:g9320.t1
MDELIIKLLAAEADQNTQNIRNVVANKNTFQSAILNTDIDNLFVTLGLKIHPQSCTVVLYHMSNLIQQKLVLEEMSTINDSNNDDNDSSSSNNWNNGSTTANSKQQETFNITATTTASLEQASPLSFVSFLRHVSAFFLQGNVKIANEFLSSELSDICRCAATVAARPDQAQNAGAVIKGLEQVIFQLNDVFPGCLFPAHVSLLKVSLATRNFKSAINVLNKSVYSIEPKRTGLCTKEMLLYFYYGGMVYTYMKLYKKATELFLNCVLCPSKVLSAIAMEAYKKYYLTSLLAYGNAPKELPKSASSIVKRNAPSLVRSYKNFVDAYKANDLNLMKLIAQENLEEFQSDQNMALICHCLLAFKRHQIKKLTNTYITLSLQDVAKKVNLLTASDAESAVQDMINCREIFAEIDHDSQMVRFFDDPQQYDDENALKILGKRVAETEELARCINDVNKKVSLSKKFLLTIPANDTEVESTNGSSGGASKMMDTENEQKA